MGIRGICGNHSHENWKFIGFFYKNFLKLYGKMGKVMGIPTTQLFLFQGLPIFGHQAWVVLLMPGLVLLRFELHSAKAGFPGRLG